MADKIVSFVKVFDARKNFGLLTELSESMNMNHIQLSYAMRDELIERFELLESLLERALPLLERSKNIINDQMPGVPHLIEGSLEQLRIDIDDALTKVEFVERPA